MDTAVCASPIGIPVIGMNEELDQVEALPNLLISCATGSRENNPEYVALRNSLMANSSGGCIDSPLRADIADKRTIGRRGDNAATGPAAAGYS